MVAPHRRYRPGAPLAVARGFPAAPTFQMSCSCARWSMEKPQYLPGVGVTQGKGGRDTGKGAAPRSVSPWEL